MINYNNNEEEEDDFEREMDEFFEKIASIDSCYNNGYKLITNKRTLAELTQEKLVVVFPFNPKQKESFLKVADLMIS
jgi:Lon protease-like protein